MAVPSFSNPRIIGGFLFTYEIEKVIGQGSFGVNYLASIVAPNKCKDKKFADGIHKVVIKELRSLPSSPVAVEPPRTFRSSTTEPTITLPCVSCRNSFLSEIVNLSKLQHPNIVDIIEAFEVGGALYYVMDHIESLNLYEYAIINHGLSEEETINIAKQIGSALSFMHSKNIYHFDLKPSNILRKLNGDILIIDLGCSKQLHPLIDPTCYSELIPSGTIGYTPIEQMTHQEKHIIPAAIDIYALGGTMFYLLTGIQPPSSSGIFNDGFPLYALQEKGVSTGLSSCIAKAMAPKIKDRFQSVDEFLAALNDKESFSFEYEIAQKPLPAVDNINKVTEYSILTDTSLVVITFTQNTFKLLEWRTIIAPDHVKIENNQNDKFFLHSMDKEKYDIFLLDLQNLNLSIREEKVPSEIEFLTGQPGRLEINLYDKQQKLYAKYWITGWNNEFGNINDDLLNLMDKLNKIVPYHDEYSNNNTRHLQMPPIPKLLT